MRLGRHTKENQTDAERYRGSRTGERCLMVWARLDDAIMDNPKVAKVGPMGFALYVASITYCARNLTDGYVPRAVARRLIDPTWTSRDGGEEVIAAGPPDPNGHISAWEITPESVINQVLDAGLWEYAEGGYTVHDFLDYNPSRVQVEGDRMVREGARRAGGLARAAGANRDPGGKFISAGQTSDAPAADQFATSPGPGPGPEPLELAHASRTHTDDEEVGNTIGIDEEETEWTRAST
jgi:hypothetical protein